MLERVVESRLDDDTMRRTIRDRTQRFLELRLTADKERELRVEREVPWIAEDEIHALLRNETCAHGDDRHLVGRTKPELTLQRLATFDFAHHRVARVVRVKNRIGGWIPDLLIDAVRDADEPIAQRDEHPVEAKPARR